MYACVSGYAGTIHAGTACGPVVKFSYETKHHQHPNSSQFYRGRGKLMNLEPKSLNWKNIGKERPSRCLPVVCHKKCSATVRVCGLRVTGYTYG